MFDLTADKKLIPLCREGGRGPCGCGRINL